MTPTLAQLTRSRPRDLRVVLDDDDVVNLIYDAGAVTPTWGELFEQARTADEMGQALAQVITGWEGFRPR